MLVNGIMGSSGGAPMTEEEAEGGEEMGLDEDAVEIVEGDADDDGDDDDAGAWFDGPAPLRLRIGILELKISLLPLS
jgi:hypothetical protein